MVDSKAIREKVLYPVTRVRTSKGGGSGVLVYSKPDPKEAGHFINLVLTCEHVVDDNIKVSREWDAVLKRDRKRDFFEEASVELFDYDRSKVISSNSTQADIVAYDKRHDIAMLRLHNFRSMPFVADIISKKGIKALEVCDPVWVSGCSMLHDPFCSPGTLTYLREIIEQKSYLMSNAPSIFGNSGGGLFHEESLSLLGLTSRISAIQLGFGVDIITWMGFSTHPDRLYEFFDEQELKFMYDPADDYHSAMARREKKQAIVRTMEAKEEIITGGDEAPQ